MTGQRLPRLVQGQPGTTVLRQAIGTVHHPVLHRILHHGDVLFDSPDFVERRGQTGHHSLAVGVVFEVTLDDQFLAGDHLGQVVGMRHISDQLPKLLTHAKQTSSKCCFLHAQHESPLTGHGPINGIEIILVHGGSDHSISSQPGP